MALENPAALPHDGIILAQAYRLSVLTTLNCKKKLLFGLGVLHLDGPYPRRALPRSNYLP